MVAWTKLIENSLAEVVPQLLRTQKLLNVLNPACKQVGRVAENIQKE